MNIIVYLWLISCKVLPLIWGWFVYIYGINEVKFLITVIVLFVTLGSSAFKKDYARVLGSTKRANAFLAFITLITISGFFGSSLKEIVVYIKDRMENTLISFFSGEENNPAQQHRKADSAPPRPISPTVSTPPISSPHKPDIQKPMMKFTPLSIPKSAHVTPKFVPLQTTPSASLQAPIESPRPKLVPYVTQTQPPVPAPAQIINLSNEKTLPIAIRAEEQSAPGHFLDGNMANDLFGLFKAGDFNTFDEVTDNVDESKISLFIDILSVQAQARPDENTMCDGEYRGWIATATVQTSLTWNNGEILYPPELVTGDGSGCADDKLVRLHSEQAAVQDAATKIISQFQANVSK